MTNPLLKEKKDITVDVEKIETKTTNIKKVNPKKELRDLRRKENAGDAIKGFKKGVELYGFTKGLFSLSDLLEELLKITGPAELFISTWTASKANVANMIKLIQSGKITKSYWFVDFSFHRRCPELSMEIRKVFGDDAVRIGKNHAKFTLIKNNDWDIVVQTSMNLNQNPRFENFTIAHDPQLASFLGDILNELWSKQDKDLAFGNYEDIINGMNDNG
jgi:hypothetical protein